MRIGGADVLDAEDVDEELGQFEDALHPVPAQVGDAGRGRRHDGLVAREDALEALDQRVAVIGIARIRVQLPATRLRFRNSTSTPRRSSNSTTALPSPGRACR
jgi:hypothetical protein